MRTLSVEEVTVAVSKAVIEANTILPEDVRAAIQMARDHEAFPRARNILNVILENAKMARAEQMALCQDTGLVVVDLYVGQEVHFTGGSVEAAIQGGVREGYRRGHFRNSVVADPLIRINTGDNTPAIIHTHLVQGVKVEIKIMPKGAGSENMGAMAVFNPEENREAINKFIVDTVKKAGANPCPPIIIGVGCGGNLENCMYLAKKALFRPLDRHNEQEDIAIWEEEILAAVNKLNIGPQGLGGDTTALAVNIETGPTHIASLPVAVNLNCHCTRRAEVVI